MGWPLLHAGSSRVGRRIGDRGRWEIPENQRKDDARFDQQKEPPGAHWGHCFPPSWGGPQRRPYDMRKKNEDSAKIYRSMRETRTFETQIFGTLHKTRGIHTNQWSQDDGWQPSDQNRREYPCFGNRVWSSASTRPTILYRYRQFNDHGR